MQQDLLRSITRLWELKAPWPGDFFKCEQFSELMSVCEATYGISKTNMWVQFSLYHSLRACGMPCYLPANKSHLTLSAENTAEKIDKSFTNTAFKNIHIVPLDCLDDGLPDLIFGTSVVKKFTRQELAELFNSTQIESIHSKYEFDIENIEDIIWLVVTEEVQVTDSVEKRTNPLWFSPINDPEQDKVRPHASIVPAIVEKALFCLLLAPWEDWHPSADWQFKQKRDWRAFKFKWIYTKTTDLFSAAKTPPDFTLLSWDTLYAHDRNGNEIECEFPIKNRLTTQKLTANSIINETNWQKIERSIQSGIISLPAIHFFVKAFTSDGIDELLYNIIAIEAALGDKNDTKNGGLTACLARRISILLEDSKLGEQFRAVYKLRCSYVHGGEMDKIDQEDRTAARKLVRLVMTKLLDYHELHPKLHRECLLQQLMPSQPKRKKQKRSGAN